VHKPALSAWEDVDIPGIHGPYDYDVLLTEEKQKTSRLARGPPDSRPAWGKREPPQATKRGNRLGSEIPRPSLLPNIT